MNDQTKDQEVEGRLRFEAMERYLARRQGNHDVLLRLTREQADAIDTAISCFSYAQNGDMETVEECYGPDDMGLREQEFKLAIGVSNDIRAITKFLNEQDPDYRVAIPPTDVGEVEGRFSGHIGFEPYPPEWTENDEDLIA